MKKVKCPNGCNENEFVTFCGLKKNNKNLYENSWECNRCGHKWTTEISEETKNEFNS